MSFKPRLTHPASLISSPSFTACHSIRPCPSFKVKSNWITARVLKGVMLVTIISEGIVAGAPVVLNVWEEVFLPSILISKT